MYFGLQLLLLQIDNNNVVLCVDLITVASKLVGKVLGYQCICGVFLSACNILNGRVRHPQCFHCPAQKGCELKQVKHQFHYCISKYQSRIAKESSNFQIWSQILMFNLFTLVPTQTVNHQLPLSFVKIIHSS